MKISYLESLSGLCSGQEKLRRINYRKVSPSMENLGSNLVFTIRHQVQVQRKANFEGNLLGHN